MSSDIPIQLKTVIQKESFLLWILNFLNYKRVFEFLWNTVATIQRIVRWCVCTTSLNDTCRLSIKNAISIKFFLKKTLWNLWKKRQNVSFHSFRNDTPNKLYSQRRYKRRLSDLQNYIMYQKHQRARDVLYFICN